MAAPAIHQMLPNYWLGDAIGNTVTEMRKLLVSWGYQSEVYADIVHGELSALPYREFALEDPEAWVIYHYSTGSAVNGYALENVKNLILMYHNVTPAEFFEPYDVRAAESCRAGRALLPRFAPKTRLAMAVSPYNAGELEALRFREIEVVPCVMNLAARRPAGALPYGDGKTNILFVGRMAPNKGHGDLLRAFHVYRRHLNPNSRLVIVGGYSPGARYFESLKAFVKAYNIPDVEFTGFVSDERLGGYYAAAAVFLCLSRHEGFCVPLIEAMGAGVPVAAYPVTGVAGTLNGAGMAIDPAASPAEIAEALHELVTNQPLRAKLIEGQRARAADFGYEKTSALFRRVIERVVEGRA
ncbi:MAG: glycosyltransferase family 4 protein [Nitrospinae bacterium]|nr:glycosyltransferase family 4 protein [Nitrospinota bacterium]